MEEVIATIKLVLLLVYSLGALMAHTQWDCAIYDKHDKPWRRFKMATIAMFFGLFWLFSCWCLKERKNEKGL